MTGLLDKLSAHRMHLSEDTLTRMVCEELSPLLEFPAKRHLEACSQCQARYARLARTSLEIAEHRQEVVQQLEPLSAARRALFIQELDTLLESGSSRPLRRRLLDHFVGVRPFWNFALSLPRALIVLCAGLALILFFRLHVPPVSAAEFLGRAMASEQIPARVSGPGAIHRRFRVKTTKKTIEHDTYRDISGRRQPRTANVDASEAELAIRLALAGVSWDDPLSAASYKSWHDRQQDPKDEVHSSGKNLLTISTRLPSTDISQESLTVREDGFHPVERTIEYREFGTVEISEVSLDFLSWDKSTQLFFEPEVINRVAVRLAPPHAYFPTAAQMNESELEVRLMLNRLSADTGEQIAIARNNQGLQVQGLVESEERKRQLNESLQAIPFLSVSIRSFDDLKSALAPNPQVAVTQEQSTVAQISPFEQYFVRDGRSRDDLSRISAGLYNSSLAINRSCKSMEELSQRFSADNDLTPAAILARDDLLSRIVTRVLEDLKEQQQFLAEASFTLEPGESDPKNPEAASFDLTHLAEKNAAATRELISGADGEVRSEKAIAAEVADTISQLRIAVLASIPGHSIK